MKEYDIQKLINNSELLDEKIKKYKQENILRKQELDVEEINGHILKSENNLRFTNEILQKGFLDWALTGCYYACYHMILALIQTKKYTSKNHNATLCIIIKEFYNKELNKQDMDLIMQVLEYEDILFYVETKNKREDATYSTKFKYE